MGKFECSLLFDHVIKKRRINFRTKLAFDLRTFVPHLLNLKRGKFRKFIKKLSEFDIHEIWGKQESEKASFLEICKCKETESTFYFYSRTK